MTGSEQREAARQFINRWRGKGKEDEDGRSYWIELLSNVFGVENVTERIDFEKKVVVDGNTKRIDVYIPETRVIIEQKSLNVPLNKKIRNSGDIDLTPFEQADRYNSNTIVYNNFPWPETTDQQRQKIKQTAQAILDARSLYPDSSLADLYDPLTMPPELLKAHTANNKAVM